MPVVTVLAAGIGIGSGALTRAYRGGPTLIGMSDSSFLEVSLPPPQQVLNIRRERGSICS